MRKKLLIILIFFIFSACEKIIKKEINSYDLISENSKVVISVKNIGKFKNSIDNNGYLNSLVNSNLTIKNLVSQISMINDDKEIVIGLYENDGLLEYDIIGLEITNDSITDKKLKYDEIDIISSNNKLIPVINDNYFGKKFQKINQTNINFSVALDSSYTEKLLRKIFDIESSDSNRNIILNIDASGNLISLNGVVDDSSIDSLESNEKLAIQEIISSEKKPYFDFKNDLIEDYDLISSNLDKNLNIFDFDSSESKSKYYKIFQLKKGDKIININGYISDLKREPSNSMIDLKFESNITNDVIHGPQIVKNHINNSNEVLIQDSKNILYLINNRGQVEWTREIDGKIIKEINQIDSYKNGKLQYVFTTAKSLNLLDRKGRNVGKFPLKFRDEITKPVSVFDYDKNKNYRLLITQNDELFMFDSRGNRVRGFNYSKKNKIITTPKHFRIGNKDIIVFKTTDHLTILNRRGAVRINPKTKHNYSSDEIFQYQNLLVTSTLKNEIVKIDMNGNTKLHEPMPINSKVKSNKKTIFTLQKNILSNSKINVEIPFGKYDDFNVLTANDKTYVNIFDSQNNKIYLFNNELNLINGFPISSNENAHFIIDKGSIEFTTLTENKNIRYQIVR